MEEKPAVSRHLWSGATRGKFPYSGANQTCSRAWQPHPFCPGKAWCTVLLSFDVLVTTGLILPQQDGLQNSSVGDSSMAWHPGGLVRTTGESSWDY